MLSTLTVAVLFLFVPGALVALALGVRGWIAAGTAPLLSLALVVLAITAVTVLDVRWSPGAFGVVAAVAVLLVLGATMMQRRLRGGTAEGDRDDPEGGAVWSVLTAGGVLLGAGIGFWAVVGGTGGLTRPNQGFDALFHVNLVETITRSGDVSPAVAGRLNGYADGTSVYPDALHALASLVAQSSAGGTVMSINALMACIPLVGGVGLVALLRSVGLVRVAAVVPVVLAATSGYPVDLIWRGPIWVFVFGVAVVPAFLALLLRVLGHGSAVSVVVLGIAAAGLAVVHPSAALSAAVFAACLVGGRWLSDRAAIAPDVRVLLPAALVAALLCLPLIGQAVVDTGGGTVVDWPAVQSAGEVLGELLLYNYDNDYPQLWLALPALVGLVVGWRTGRLRWWAAGTGVFALLCVLAAAYEGPLVALSTGPWWNDRFRLAGLVFLGLAVFAAVGIVVIGQWIGSALRWLPTRGAGRSPRAHAFAVPIGVVLAVALLGLLSGGFYVAENQDRLEVAYRADGGGGSVSSADLVAFDVLRGVAGTGPVLNDPNDGSPWMWALAGVRPVFGAALTTPVKPPLPDERQILIDGLNCIDSNEQVREAVEELGVRYVYSSDSPIVGGESPNVGFRELSSVASLDPVYQRDGATIYEIDPVPLQDDPDTACRLS